MTACVLFCFITVLCSVLLPFSVSFLLPLAFKRYRLTSVFLVTCNTYVHVRTSYVHRRDSDKTYASCWLARVAVGSLMLRCLRHTVITRSNWLYMYHHHQGLPGGISRKLQKEGIKATGRRIAKFLGKFIESGPVPRKPGSVETKRTVERN